MPEAVKISSDYAVTNKLSDYGKKCLKEPISFFFPLILSTNGNSLYIWHYYL